MHINDKRLEQARFFGATHTINGGVSKDVVGEIKALTGGSTNYAFDSTGVPKIVPIAIKALRAKGMCGTVGSFSPGETAPIDLLDFLPKANASRGLLRANLMPMSLSRN
jgi:aryl-alcohol dehydrogenase